MHITHHSSRVWSRSDRALLVVHLLVVIYMGLCVPDLYAGLQRTVGGDAGRERLTAAIENPAPLRGAPETVGGKPYPRGAVHRQMVGDALVLTTRSAANEPLCAVRFADGTTTTSWADGRNELCPASVALPLPTDSPVDPAACSGASCWLADAERALWRCVEQTGTPEGCHAPEALRRHGLPERAPVLPYRVIGPGDMPENTVVVNTSALLEGTVSYTIVAREAGADWVLSYFSDRPTRSVLACTGVCPVGATRRAL